jgi:hypothetical protein
MVKNINLTIQNPLSQNCIKLGLTHLYSVYKYVQQIPYGRNSNRSDYTLILEENKGTCSTKHAFLKALALENDYNNIELRLGIFEMNSTNTIKISKILNTYKLDYIPEAHCYLKLNHTINDITFNCNKPPIFSKTLMHEEYIIPNQIGNYKVNMHQKFIKSWIEKENISLNFDKIWEIRELCIAQLSE